ncbi:mercuric reductase [Catalinimonas niigatensis]|uniref:mercuric reductase n=1 Tax=Catalinimonas niigatensis TaxID=1397264 RepID=UPI002666F472|nr:mercuric reductase [Catalinimonas niigatensis]WPP51666.1 mercuric reductase [Catalinimonas niigatensis]
METYDAIIIGIGQAGNPLSATLAEQGLKTAVIEREHPGGSCVNYGCTPTKTMLASATASHVIRTSTEVGIQSSPPQTNFQKVIERRNNMVKKSREGIEKKILETENITYLFGEARFIGNKLLQIKMNEGEEAKEITAEKIFINVGTSPRIPEIEGLDKVDYLTAKSMMKLQELPEHLAIIGGSYIGLEFGQMYRRLGSKVTVIQQEGHLAPKEDEDVSEAMQEFLEEEGIEVYLNTKPVHVEKKGSGLSIQTKGNVSKTLDCSHLLIATGTTPNTEVLNLDKTRVKLAKHQYIEVNQHLETNIDGIFALGDCKGGPEFTHISYDDFRIVNDYLFGKKKRKLDDRMQPYTMFTKPELGRVGLNEKQAKEKGINYKIAQMPMTQSARAKEANETNGLLKVLIDPKSKKILGATCLAEIGGEIMSMLQIAMMGGLTYEQLRDGVFAHPTYAESLNNLFVNVEDPG